MEQVEQEYQTESNDVEFPGDDGLFMGSVALLDLQFSYNFSATEANIYKIVYSWLAFINLLCFTSCWKEGLAQFKHPTV